MTETASNRDERPPLTGLERLCVGLFFWVFVLAGSIIGCILVGR